MAGVFKVLTKAAAEEGATVAVRNAAEDRGYVNTDAEEESTTSAGDTLIDGMAEAIVLAAAWFTVRMVCQVSYNAIKTYRETKKLEKMGGQPDEESLVHAVPVGGGCAAATTAVVVGGAKGEDADGASAVGYIPWDPAERKIEDVPRSQGAPNLREDDREWIDELRRATNTSARDSIRILDEIRGVGDKVDNLPLETLYDKLRHAMKLLLEYQQNPGFRSAPETLLQAEAAAREVYTNERSLVMNLSALRLRIVITYLHCPKHSQGLEPSMDDKAADKAQCELYISNALKQGALETLCRKFLESRDSPDKKLRERVERETMVAFDIILEVITSVFMLEPFRPSQGPLPTGAPDVVIHALSTYCDSGLGNSPLYTDVALALQEWRAQPERQERWALHCLYRRTNGPGWACNDGWNNLFEGDLSRTYGVSTVGGRITKISLGANDLDGRLPPQLDKLVYLEELSLPGNKLFGKVPSALWELPCLRVVALQKNSFTVTPPETFKPAENSPATALPTGASGFIHLPARRRQGIAGKVEACHPARMELYEEEWFTCSWKIANIGGVVFPKTTKLSRVGDEMSVIGGAQDVMINPLRPGEEQTVSVMQQAPDHETWCKDEWALVGEGLDFVDEKEAKAPSPTITVVGRDGGNGGQRSTDASDGNDHTLANTVFVTAQHRRRSTRHSPHPSHQYFHHLPGGQPNSRASSC
ncbi:unnamed protein product [Scytosiphon promiscuus]